MDKYAINFLAKSIITGLSKYKEIKRADISLKTLNQTDVDSLIDEMVKSKYIILDCDEQGNIVLKKNKNREEAETIHEDSNAIFIESTNEEMSNDYLFYDGKIFFRNQILYFYGRFSENIFHTSLLKNYEIKDDIVTFETMNSIYKFRILKDIEIDKSILASAEEIKEAREKFDYWVESGVFFV